MVCFPQSFPHQFRTHFPHLNNNNNHEIKELQKKTAILGTAHTLRKVLMLKYKTYFTGGITLHVAQIVHTEQWQHYIP